MPLHLQIPNPNLPVLQTMTKGMFIDWSWVYNVLVMLANSRSSATEDNIVAIGSQWLYIVFLTICLLLEDIVGHQLTVVFLEASQYVRDGVVDRIGRVVMVISKVHFLDPWKHLLHENLLRSHHLSEQTHFLGVCNPHVGICVVGCAFRDYKRTLLHQAD